MKVPVLVPKIFDFPFTYDSGSFKNLAPGDIVVIPFGKKEEIGVVWDKIQPSKKETFTQIFAWLFLRGFYRKRFLKGL